MPHLLSELPDLLLGGRESEVAYMLEFLDHVLVGFTEKRSSEFQYIVGIPDPLLGGQYGELMYMLEILRPFAMWVYRENDPLCSNAP